MPQGTKWANTLKPKIPKGKNALILSSPKIPQGAKCANTLKPKTRREQNMLIPSFCILLQLILTRETDKKIMQSDRMHNWSHSTKCGNIRSYLPFMINFSMRSIDFFQRNWWSKNPTICKDKMHIFHQKRFSQILPSLDDYLYAKKN